MRIAPVALAATLAATPTFAQETPADADRIIVTGGLEREAEVAGRLGLTNRETPATVEIVTQEDFQRQGVRNAIEALNAAPGVSSGALPGSLASVSMRGFHRAVNFLYDGVRMANSDVGLRNWDAFSFQRIEVTQRYGQDYDPLSWRVGTVLSVTPGTQLFAQYSTAIAPISGLLCISAANAAFDLTTGHSTEAGIKTSLTGSNVELTASAFRIRQDDIVTRDPANPALSVQGGTLRSQGVELALDLTVTPELGVTFGGTMLDAEYLELVEAGGADRAGNRPPNVPELLADLVLTYTPAALPVTFTAVARHNGGFFTSNANTFRVNAFTTLDASASLTTGLGTLTLRGRNLTDAFYADWSGYAAGLVFVGAPRSVELLLTRTF